MAHEIHDSVLIGSTKSYSEFGKDGTLGFSGDARQWDDIQTSLVGRRLSNPGVGTLQYNYTNNSITMSPGGDITNLNDYVTWNIQYPHKAVEDGTFNLHVHWEQYDNSAREFTVEYRIQTTGGVKQTNWTRVVVTADASSNVAEYPGSGTINQITRLVDISMAGFGLSAQVQFRFTRSDVVAGDIEATFIDCHYQSDLLGSKREFSRR